MTPSPSGLVLNTNARISIRNRDDTTSFVVEAPIKGQSLSRVRVDAEHLPHAYAFLNATLVDGHDNAGMSPESAAELQQIGLFAPHDALPQAVDYVFPTRTHAASTLTHTSIADVAELHAPADWPLQTLHFEPHHHGSVWAPVMIANAPGERVPSPRIPHPDVALDDDETRAHFEREGFALLDNLLPMEHVSALARYFQALAAQGFLSRHDDAGTLRHIAHSHPVARFWHEQLNARVSQLVGRKTKPSYSYVSLYIAGGDLAWHTDRPPCEYTITLLLDYAPLDADARSRWALRLQGRDGALHSLHQRIGDALIFMGRELSHGRDTLPDGHRSASLLFHFVDEDYDGIMA